MKPDRMQQQRFELKYVVEEATALEIRGFVDHYLDLDEFGIGQPFSAYPVNSLYLDSNDLATFRQWVNADRNRFKLRMRFYDAQPDTPVFLEIKRRVAECICKQRCGVKKSAVSFVLAGQSPPLALVQSHEPKHLAALENYISTTQQLRARPQVLVTYLREAYLDLNNNAVRVTLDRRVRMSQRSVADFRLQMDEFVQPFGDKVIVEIKFTNQFPAWAGEMARALELRRDGAAKYCEGVANLWQPHHAHWNHELHLAPAASARATGTSAGGHLRDVLADRESPKASQRLQHHA